MIMAESEFPQPDAPFTAASIKVAIQAGRATAADVKKALKHAVPVPTELPESTPSPPPEFTSFNDWCVRTSVKEKREYCHTRAKSANSKRLLSPKPTYNVKTWEVWHIIEDAKGRCAYCGSLAVEKRPSNEKGHPIPWSNVGRRVGSLGHRVARFHGGGDEPDNLQWCCLWCNDWVSERIPGAANHGGYYPEEPDQGGNYENPYPEEKVTAMLETAAKRRDAREEEEQGDLEDLDLYQWPYLHEGENY